MSTESAGELPGVLVIGEALVDVVERPGQAPVAYPGGSAANVAVALARLGRPTALATCLAEDEYGALLREHLSGSGVTFAGDPGTVSRTSSARARIAADGSASYDFDLDWRPPDPGPGAPLAVYTSSIAAVLQPGAARVAEVIDRFGSTSTICYDINARPSITGTGAEVVTAVEALVARCDVVKASDEDLEALWPGRSLRDSLHALAALGPACVVVTRGAEGALLVAAGEEAVVPATRTEVADTIGAGDTFGAGLLDALWERNLLGGSARERLRGLTARDWVPPLTWAARCAAVTVSRPGADPPRRDEVG